MKALGIRYFSNYQKLLPIACFKPIIACLSLFINKKDPVTLYQFLFSLLFSYNNIVSC
nr:MAG TPA: hypothetical protein [Caudoviricetes sp.]